MITHLNPLDVAFSNIFRKCNTDSFALKAKTLPSACIKRGIVAIKQPWKELVSDPKSSSNLSHIKDVIASRSFRQVARFDSRLSGTIKFDLRYNIPWNFLSFSNGLANLASSLRRPRI